MLEYNAQPFLSTAMFKKIFVIACLAFINQPNVQAQQTLGKQNFDFDWKFHNGGAISAENYNYDDAGWRKLDVPHDWSIEDLKNTNSPFDINAISQVNGGFTTGGTGWYRKYFDIPSAYKGKKITITFDGVYMNSSVWINGKLLGGNPYGYTEFSFDITNHLHFDKKNVIAVKVSNEGDNSRWYAGSGIYRQVWLTAKNQTHVAKWGTYITTPLVKKATAITNIKTQINNQSPSATTVRLLSIVLDKQRNIVNQLANTAVVKAGVNFVFDQNITLQNLQPWAVANPYLYTLVSKVFINGELTESTETPFGIRTLKFSSNGFFINGENTKLKGGCLHHDNGPLGAKTYDRAEVRKVEILKAAGFNAVRTSHNPPSTAFLNACDSLGMLVIDEAFDCWKDGKNPHDYSLYFDKFWKKDIEAMVLRDRNHPSIIMWSNGNEIPNRETPAVAAVSTMINNYIKKLDPTRPTTSGVNDLKPNKDGFFATLNVAGYNYAAGGDHSKNDVYAEDHKRVPARLMYESEAYPLEAFDSWQKVLEKPYVFGAFVWTALDYIGEAGIGWHGYWPSKNSYPFTLAYCGDIDICGNKRPISYYRDALWKTNQLSIFVTPPTTTLPLNPDREEWSKWHWHDVQADWNHSSYQNKPLDVVTYSSCDDVELFLNDKSLGKKPTNKTTKFLANWKVPYQNGVLKAVGYTNNKNVNESILRTAAPAQTINMLADRSQINADGQDLSYVQITLTDANGILNPKADNLIKFSIDGPGEIIAVGNGMPTSLESYQAPQRKAWQGKCLVIIKSIKSQGKIVLKAAADGLTAATVTIETTNK